jgi:hypothetical protein
MGGLKVMATGKVPDKGSGENRDILWEEYTGVQVSIFLTDIPAPVFPKLKEPQVLSPAWRHKRADEPEVTCEFITEILGEERLVVVGYSSASDSREEIHQTPVSVVGKVHPVNDGPERTGEEFTAGSFEVEAVSKLLESCVELGDVVNRLAVGSGGVLSAGVFTEYRLNLPGTLLDLGSDDVDGTPGSICGSNRGGNRDVLDTDTLRERRDWDRVASGLPGAPGGTGGSWRRGNGNRDGSTTSAGAGHRTSVFGGQGHSSVQCCVQCFTEGCERSMWVMVGPQLTGEPRFPRGPPPLGAPLRGAGANAPIGGVRVRLYAQRRIHRILSILTRLRQSII